MIDREELRRLCEAATPGPWRACNDGACACRMIWSRAVDCVVAVGISAKDEQYTSGEGIVDDKALMSNAAFIAAARTAVPALLDALEAAEAKHDSDANLIDSLRFQVDEDRRIGAEWKSRALEAEARANRLRSYMLGDATCPCCQQVDMCLPGCTFPSDAPEAADRMADVRAELAETAP